MGTERGWHGGGKGDTAAAGRVEMPREREVDFRVGRAPMVPGPLFLCWEEVGPLGEDRAMDRGTWRATVHEVVKE